ncbi:isoaspartyl peptidase/L-asparaginase [Aphanizomenon flos-aquae NRERC-008]|jgi:L-asparaginase|uniref:Isoaspartyl peptidase/L-asparaginase n=1 Tax=Aphanizomenon flos-aquae FACHB-1249 TaxID=2692889 RepID=A0ABR8IV68_APHFL|nr:MULTISPECIES: isoaspartyl peptidase/L-asparaginase [Aphanizomenon]MBD1215790.1 isoaspartyl peptidase/L-asparaginase [Aphanizomenon flos-aquae Clear-A1]MCE2904071.1 isoaspartyl peptidase/L-asparaginase [Anabaena sp. CoA2_C59]MDJ0506763.1 isoaspartyl peptidase/L-asparaginase [Nostocales cyanobacterium LE14-WE12]MBD2391815.1 isoaspartyl peptidase/L-asparaginase [Aphanizomenon flos-aquae FACHB-1171]MBD2558471.1 isoaspartyl peptidase/L-asparaginase [Aphanizomenon flos-aquae FACHB-1290]
MTLQVQPKLIIHGGAGSSLQGKGGLIAVRNSLSKIVADIYTLLLNGGTATEAIVKGCQMLEDEPRFNAGTGSVLQSDGQIRMSASMMDGTTGRFSGVINVSRVKNPIAMALFLQSSDDRVLSDYGAAELARELQIPIYNGLTDLRLQEWTLERQGNFQRTMAGVVAEPEMAVSSNAGRGTIGVVALDGYGKLAAGTSTGGKGFERIGRVSDSAMPAGNYANIHAGVSCTGIGEDIIDECLAAKVVIRVTDGMSLQDAMQKSFTEAKKNNRDFGAIALDATGMISYGKTCEVLLAAYHNGENIGDTLEWNDQELIGH